MRASCDWEIRQQLATGWKPEILMSPPVASVVAKSPFSRLPCGLNKHTCSASPIALLLIERHHFVFILCDELIIKNVSEPIGMLGVQGVSLWPIPSVLKALRSTGQQECNAEARGLGVGLSGICRGFYGS